MRLLLFAKKTSGKPGAPRQKSRENIARSEGCFILINRVNYSSVLSAFSFSGRIHLRFRPSFDFRGLSPKPGLNGGGRRSAGDAGALADFAPIGMLMVWSK